MINCALKSMWDLLVVGPERRHFAFQQNWHQDKKWIYLWDGMNIKLIISHVISPQELLRLKLVGEFNY